MFWIPDPSLNLEALLFPKIDVHTCPICTRFVTPLTIIVSSYCEFCHSTKRGCWLAGVGNRCSEVMWCRKSSSNFCRQHLKTQKIFVVSSYREIQSFLKEYILIFLSTYPPFESANQLQPRPSHFQNRRKKTIDIYKNKMSRDFHFLQAKIIQKENNNIFSANTIFKKQETLEFLSLYYS